jgi:anti-anti-sigma factor
MFDIWRNEDGTISLVGRLDASHAERARDFLASVDESVTLDFSDLAYISSAGLGVLIAVQRRLTDHDHRLRIRHLNRQLTELFEIAGFRAIFEIE